MKNGKLTGKEVLLVHPDGGEVMCFVAFIDDKKGMAIKDIETQKDVLCHDIKLWDKKRKAARAVGQPMLYKHAGKYVHDYLKECIRAGIIHGTFVHFDLKNNGIHVCSHMATCPSGG